MTAVQWLYENLLLEPMYNEDVIYNEDVLEMAKEMEKQQIIDAVKSTDYIIGATDKESEEFAQQYYNEKYNNED